MAPALVSDFRANYKPAGKAVRPAPKAKHQDMNGSKPFGRSEVFRRSASAVRKASVSFPLTPALSLGERENFPPPPSTPQRSVCPTNFHTEPASDCSLSPWERVRVRGIGLLLDRATQTSPEIAECRHLNDLLRGPRICCHDCAIHHTLCAFQPIYHRNLSEGARSSLPSEH